MCLKYFLVVLALIGITFIMQSQIVLTLQYGSRSSRLKLIFTQ